MSPRKGLEISADVDAPPFFSLVLNLPSSRSLPLSSNDVVALRITRVFQAACSYRTSASHELCSVLWQVGPNIGEPGYP